MSQALPKFLDSQPYQFAIDLAALASRREFLNLEKWLIEKTEKNPDSSIFIKACLEFLNEKVMIESMGIFNGRAGDHGVVSLSGDVVKTFLRVLQELNKKKGFIFWQF